MVYWLQNSWLVEETHIHRILPPPIIVTVTSNENSYLAPTVVYNHVYSQVSSADVSVRFLWTFFDPCHLQQPSSQ